MLYRLLTALIEKGQTSGLAGKIDIFYGVGKLTESQYHTLIALLPAETEQEETIRTAELTSAYTEGVNSIDE